MTVAELIAALKTMPPNAEVIMQRDSEGNGYSPLYAVDGDAIYTPETTYSGDVVSTNWSAADADMSVREWRKFKASNPRCVVLAPTN